MSGYPLKLRILGFRLAPPAVHVVSDKRRRDRNDCAYSAHSFNLLLPLFSSLPLNGMPRL